MDGEGIVGLNPSKALNDIKNINSSICDMQNSLVNSTEAFFTDLSLLWYAPKAIDFATKILPKLETINDEIISFNDTTITNCVSAFNRLASSHGTSGINVAPGPYTTANYPVLKDVGPDGQVGMQVAQVRTSVDAYLSAIKGISGALAGVPSRIAFYDTDGGFSGACQTNVNRLRNLIEDAISAIIAEIEPAIQENTQSTEQAASTAAQTMGGAGHSF